MTGLVPLMAMVGLGEAWACPFEAGADAAAGSAEGEAAAHCARSGELLGANCSYTTGAMARRVLDEGEEWTWVGMLEPAKNDLPSLVASPYRAVPMASGSREPAHIIATELLEAVARGGRAESRLALRGRSLEVDGVVYVVLTAYQVIPA